MEVFLSNEIFGIAVLHAKLCAHFPLILDFIIRHYGSHSNKVHFDVQNGLGAYTFLLYTIASPFPGQLHVNDCYNVHDCLTSNIFHFIR